MKKHHVVLTEEEFDELKSVEMVSLNELPISEDEKSLLMQDAIKKSGGAAANQPIRVKCAVVDDAVVCKVIKNK